MKQNSKTTSVQQRQERSSDAVGFAILGLVVVGAIALCSGLAYDFGKKKVQAKWSQSESDKAKSKWIDSKFPGYLGEADWSQEAQVLPSIQAGGAGLVEFGLSSDGAVVWRNANDLRSGEYLKRQVGYVNRKIQEELMFQGFMKSQQQTLFYDHSPGTITLELNDLVVSDAITK